MKKLLLVLIICAAATAVEPGPAPVAPRYQHIMDNEGRIMATIDTVNEDVEFVAKPREVVLRVVKQFKGLAENCQAALNKSAPAPSPAPVAAVKSSGPQSAKHAATFNKDDIQKKIDAQLKKKREEQH